MSIFSATRLSARFSLLAPLAEGQRCRPGLEIDHVDLVRSPPPKSFPSRVKAPSPP